MKIQISKAEAFEIDPSKKYLVCFNSDDELRKETVVKIRDALLDLFTKLSVQAEVIVTVHGKIQITEVKQDLR